MSREDVVRKCVKCGQTVGLPFRPFVTNPHAKIVGRIEKVACDKCVKAERNLGKLISWEWDGKRWNAHDWALLEAVP